MSKTKDGKTYFVKKKEDGKTCVMLKFHACLSIDVEGRSRGLSVMWKENMKCRIMNYSKHFINIIVNDGDKEDWRLTCYYGYPERSRRRQT
jgi:hypothetical protein